MLGFSNQMHYQYAVLHITTLDTHLLVRLLNLEFSHVYMCARVPQSPEECIRSHRARGPSVCKRPWVGTRN